MLYRTDAGRFPSCLFAEICYDCTGFDRSGFSRDGYDRKGFDQSGFDRDGYDKEGYDRQKFNHQGIRKDGKPSPELSARFIPMKTVLSHNIYEYGSFTKFTAGSFASSFE